MYKIGSIVYVANLSGNRERIYGKVVPCTDSSLSDDVVKNHVWILWESNLTSSVYEIQNALGFIQQKKMHQRNLPEWW